MKTVSNMFLGLALADALGVPVEFKSRAYLSTCMGVNVGAREKMGFIQE